MVIHQVCRCNGIITGWLDPNRTAIGTRNPNQKRRISGMESEGKKFGNNLQPTVGDGFGQLLAENGC